MATARFAVYNADGSLQFDSSSRLLRTVAVINTQGANGSQTITGLTGVGTPTVVVTGLLNPTGADAPNITISGNTISWTFNGSGAFPPGPAVMLLIMVT